MVFSYCSRMITRKNINYILKVKNLYKFKKGMKILAKRNNRYQINYNNIYLNKETLSQYNSREEGKGNKIIADKNSKVFFSKINQIIVMNPIVKIIVI